MFIMVSSMVLAWLFYCFYLWCWLGHHGIVYCLGVFFHGMFYGVGLFFIVCVMVRASFLAVLSVVFPWCVHCFVYGSGFVYMIVLFMGLALFSLFCLVFFALSTV